MCDEYISFCREREIVYHYVNKKKGVDLMFFKNIYSKIKTSSPNTIFLHGSYSILPALAYKAKTKVKIVVRETQSNHLKTFVERRFLSIALRRAHAVAVLSEDYYKEVFRQYKVNTRLAIIPNGLDTEFFKNTTRVSEYPYRLSMVSRLVAIKDHFTLINAFSILKAQRPKLQLNIAGDGQTLPQLKAYVEENHILDVNFIGALNEGEIRDLLLQTDIYVHATFGETMSTSLMQAMAASLPILASDVPGVNNMITMEVDGLLAGVKDTAAWAQALERLLSNAELRKKLSENAQTKAVRQYSHYAMFAAYDQLISSL
jgi:glycosyltransferase involved in cell wall biosynthesis